MSVQNDDKPLLDEDTPSTKSDTLAQDEDEVGRGELIESKATHHGDKFLNVFKKENPSALSQLLKEAKTAPFTV